MARTKEKTREELTVIDQSQPTTVMAKQESDRAIAEVRAAIFLAKSFPREEKECLDRILVACQDKSLAEVSTYIYARGGTDISGPSIRLAECISLNWKNIQWGVRELEQLSGESVMEAYAWDCQNNVRVNKVFTVPHVRYTKASGNKVLVDPRDIYEQTANQGARRVRACILAIIPTGIIEKALEQCEKTLKDSADTSPEAIKKMLEKFKALGVSKEQIEKRIQRNIEAITPSQIIGLRNVYNSLNDGMSQIGDWFEVIPVSQPSATPEGGLTTEDVAPQNTQEGNMF